MIMKRRRRRRRRRGGGGGGGGRRRRRRRREEEEEEEEEERRRRRRRRRRRKEEEEERWRSNIENPGHAEMDISFVPKCQQTTTRKHGNYIAWKLIFVSFRLYRILFHSN